jgi:tRNA (cmo5U34)-methyltransferase
VHDTNRFDTEAATWDELPRRVALAEAVAAAIARSAGLPADVDVLDFGCGTGLLSLALRPLVRSVTGADASTGMLRTFREKLAARGVEDVETVLIDPAAELSLGREFDLVVSSMTLHHVVDPVPLFRAFRRHLRPGGAVALADLDREDGSFHGDQADVHHLGFDRGEIASLLREAGFAEVATADAALTHKEGRDYPVFLLTGRREG